MVFYSHIVSEGHFLVCDLHKKTTTQGFLNVDAPCSLVCSGQKGHFVAPHNVLQLLADVIGFDKRTCRKIVVLDPRAIALVCAKCELSVV